MFTPYIPRNNRTQHTPYATPHSTQSGVKYVTPVQYTTPEYTTPEYTTPEYTTPQYTTPEYTTPVQYVPTDCKPPEYFYVYPADAPAPVPVARAPPLPQSPQPTRQPGYSSIYESDEFRMYIFKIKKCPKNKSHDWTACPYVHKGEKARRRDPSKYNYVPIMCPQQRNGNCKDGDTCEFAHGIFEYWLHPAMYRTRICASGEYCQRSVCFFAHNAQELRSGSKYKCQCQQFRLSTPDQEEIPEVSEEIPPVAESTPNSSMNSTSNAAIMFPTSTGGESSKRGGIDWDVVEKLKGLSLESIGGSNIWSDVDLPENTDWAWELVGWAEAERSSSNHR